MTWVWTQWLLFTRFLQVSQSSAGCWSIQSGAAKPGSQLLIGLFLFFFSFCFFFFCTSGRNIWFSAPRTLNLLDQGLLLSTDRWNIPVNLWRFTFSSCFPPTSPPAGWFCPRVKSEICSLGANQCPGGWLRTGRLDGPAVGDQVRKAPVEVASEALNLLLTVWVSWLFSGPSDCTQLPELFQLQGGEKNVRSWFWTEKCVAPHAGIF